MVTGNIRIEIDKVLELGRGDLIFGRITSVCEDMERNFYILDPQDCRIYKFSPSGDLLKTFGRKGEGPGDMKSPFRIYLTGENNLAVSEISNHVNFFDRNGQFVKRFNVSSVSAKVGFALLFHYAGPDLYYGEKFNRDRSKQQMLFSSGGKLVQPAIFSIPDNTIKEGSRTFGYTNHEYSPMLLYTYKKGISAIAVSTRYEIKLFDQKGQKIRDITRDIPRQEIGAGEKEYYIKEARESRWPEDTKQGVIKHIPTHKCFFNRLHLTKKHLFVFRIKADTSKEENPVPVDVFLKTGEFLGTIELPKTPIFISDSHFYIRETTADVDLIVTKYSYTITINKE